MDHFFEIPIKQHSPMLHFHEQSEVTIRSTDLKPRLDRYIRKNNDLEEDVRLRYQLKVIPKKRAEKIPLNRGLHSGLYFGDMGEGPQKICLYHYDSIILKFNAYFNLKLKAWIEESLPTMLALENFGTRSNKGFGCFYLEGKGIEHFESILKEAHTREEISNIFFWDCNEGEKYRSISNFYATLKSGISFRDTPSLLCEYSYKNRILWDKHALKKHFDMFTGRERPLNDFDNKYFMRGIFGLANIQEWYGRHNDTLSIESSDFNRIPSPLVFKMCKYVKNNRNMVRIYFFARDFYKEVLDKSFVFSFKHKRQQPLTLSTPPSFDMNIFLEYVMDNFTRFKINML